MLKQDAIDFFGNKSNLARAAGVERSAVSQWGEVIPEARAARLQAASHGALVYDPFVYDQHKQARKEDLNHENQSVS
ncbi:transcriptional regulator [Superficieibacter electus]|uniref:Transcriptional regulator n=1 Tax=Superficieibacter electus TaxID=2022662 RepID=A0A2P5GVH0_9ENTR|nr:Cro/CI family transcriptional regulator [Superficieibacter electus]POP42363.1 transcriptional regulator [Superficieibacter electus]POP50552.1 transcriptional regulator [Superficieibacter electus]